MRRLMGLFGICAAFGSILFLDSRMVLPPESTRTGPAYFDHRVGNGGIEILGASNPLISDTVRINFLFSVQSRPEKYAVLASTSLGPESGVKITLDKFGNVYLLMESNLQGAYQLMLLSEPTTLNSIHSISLDIRQRENFLRVEFDGREIPLNEARPGQSLRIQDLVLRTDAFSLGGSEGQEFNGSVKKAYFVAGGESVIIDLTSLKLLASLTLMYWLSRSLTRIYSDS